MLAVLLAVPQLAGAAAVLAVVPRASPATLHNQWAPFAERVARDSGVALELRVYRNFPEFESELVRGLPDLVYLNPYQLLEAHHNQGYQPLVRDSAHPLTGILVVARDSPVKSLRDLRDKDIAFPHPNAFGASLYLRALLQEKEGLRFRAHYLNTHANVYRHVILGRAAAGGGVNRTLERDHPETRAELRVLYETPPTPAHPLSAHPRLPPAQREAVIRAILQMQDDPEGQALLQRIDLSKPVRSSYVRDYQPLENLNLRKYYIRTSLPEQ